MALRAGALRFKAAFGPSRQFRTTSQALGFGSHSSDNDPKVLEEEKRKQQKGESVSTVKDGGNWNEKLASDSEAAVKAEKHHEGDSIEDLQQHTVETTEKMHKTSHAKGK